jgi:hypothetical protein
MKHMQSLISFENEAAIERTSQLQWKYQAGKLMKSFDLKNLFGGVVVHDFIIGQWYK